MNKLIIVLFLHILSFSIVLGQIGESVLVVRNETATEFITEEPVETLMCLVCSPYQCCTLSQIGSVQVLDDDESEFTENNLEITNVSISPMAKLIFTMPALTSDIFDVTVLGEWATNQDLSDLDAKRLLAKKKLYQAGIIHSHTAPLFVYLGYFSKDDDINQLCEVASSILDAGGQIIVLALNADLSSEGMKELLKMESENMRIRRYGLKVYSTPQSLPLHLRYTHVKTTDLIRFAADFIILPASTALFPSLEDAMKQWEWMIKHKIRLSLPRVKEKLQLSARQDNSSAETKLEPTNDTVKFTTNESNINNDSNIIKEYPWSAKEVKIKTRPELNTLGNSALKS